jgi:general secretion pathway protein A
MYLDYFKLSESPFSLTPDPRYLFMSEWHREGLAHLLYGVQQPGGFVQLTGEIGSGKTTLCRCLIRQLPPDTDIALIVNPRLTVVELLATVCDELRIPHPPHTESIKVLIDALNQHLLANHAQRRRTVLIIDEAQNLHADVLEQVRLLTNLETSQEKLLQIILLGQPELLTLLKSEGLKQLSQRITARYHLKPLSKSQTYSYIQHRLLIAGRRDPLFTRWALREVYRASGGVPRVINIICDRALLGAYAQDKQRIGIGTVKKASRETSGIIPFYRRIPIARSAVLLVAAFLVFGGVSYFNPQVRSKLWKNVTKKSSFATASGEGMESSAENGAVAGVSENKKLNTANLVEILTKSTFSDSSGFADLSALWGVKFPPNSSDVGCKAAAANGLGCISQIGNWPKLRRYNLPAILELLLQNGLHRRVVLRSLKDETAVLDIDGRRYHFPISAINKLWDGSFILIWKPPFPAQKLSYGTQGEPVQWVQRALDRSEGLPSSSAASGVYDDVLRNRIKAFQRKNSLMPDGRIGSETLVRLVQVSEGPRVPMLSPKGQ